MGKQSNISQRPHCTDESAPICAHECCYKKPGTLPLSKIAQINHDPSQQEQEQFGKKDTSLLRIKNLLIIGAGPHALSLLLRLLEPDADLLSDKERHSRALYRSKERPLAEVYRHVKSLSQNRVSAVSLKQPRRKKQSKSKETNNPPPLSLETVQKSVMVVDAHGGWLSSWDQNFDALGIPKLRSLINAHADPYDHRSLEYYADLTKKADEELVPLPNLSQRDKDFRGPYQAPSTAIFQKYHKLLIRSYGIEDIVHKGIVTSINPVHSDNSDNDEPLFEVTIEFDSKPIIIKTRRVVCAMGPMFQASPAFWETEMKLHSNKHPHDKILHPPEIVPYLLKKEPKSFLNKLLIVGGGITSAQLALLAAKSSWCQTVKLIQRSKIIERQFDIETKWMGPKRGSLLEKFWSLDMSGRAKIIQQARKGGSIPPEVLHDLLLTNNIHVQEEVQISSVHWDRTHFCVSFDDGSDIEHYDMIWLATGSENHIDAYKTLSRLRTVLPIDVVNGLPVLHKDLSWRSTSDPKKEEPKWKLSARKRIWCMGSLAGLELGPDALNLVGGRQGAVRVATAIRQDMTTD